SRVSTTLELDGNEIAGAHTLDEAVIAALPSVAGADRDVHLSTNLLLGSHGHLVDAIAVGRADHEDVDVSGGGSGESFVAVGPRAEHVRSLHPRNRRQQSSEDANRAERNHDDRPQAVGVWRSEVRSDEPRPPHTFAHEDA